MRPRGLTVITRIKPGHRDELENLLDDSQTLFDSMTTVHYAAFLILPPVRNKPPRLLLETNYDGPKDGHLTDLTTQGGATLRAIYSHCAEYEPDPSDATASLKRYLRRHSRRSKAYFVAFPDRSLASIRNAIGVELERKRYLNSRQSKRSLAVGQQTEEDIFEDLVHHFRTQSAIRPLAEEVTQESLQRKVFRNLLLLVPYILVNLIFLVVSVLTAFLCEKYEEQREPYDDEAAAAQESHVGMNVGPQNHLCTVSLVKPNPFRWLILRYALSVVRTATKRVFLLTKLGEMTTIHFARWLLIDNGRTLVFLSNYDGSWSSYLGDFSHQGYGINAIWSNTISFPPTVCLFADGSYDLAAEEYRVVRHFHRAHIFYSAYKEYPVTNILQYLNFRDKLVSAIAEAERLELSMGESPRLDRDEIQGLVASGYNNLDHAYFLFLKIGKLPEAKAWLSGIVHRLITARHPGTNTSNTSLNIGLTWKGLEQLVNSSSRPSNPVSGFPLEFVQGMNRPGADLILGDTGASAQTNWQFGGSGEEVHVLLMLYGATSPDLAALQEQVCSTEEFNRGFSIVTREESHRSSGDEFEPFGYRDGISQPQVRGLGRGRLSEGDECKTGEFVIGYENVFGRIDQGLRIVHEGTFGSYLPDIPDEPGQKDLGLNGTFLVFRKLEQDVAGFTKWLNNQSDQTGGKMDPELLAAKLMGRWRSGAPLVQAPGLDNPTLAHSNDFNFANDQNGLVCPIGAHVRRANPRDSLHFSPDTSIELSNHHRLLRRGRKYDERKSVGLYFIAINANLRRQFEFVQQTWLDNPTFNGLDRNRDPIVGDHATDGVFTIPSTPVAQEITGLQRFVTVRGGGYFFLPSKSALLYLANYP